MATTDEVTLDLSRSPGDPKQFSNEYQDALHSVIAAFEVDGIATRPRFFAMDAVGDYTGRSLSPPKYSTPPQLLLSVAG